MVVSGQHHAPATLRPWEKNGYPKNRRPFGPGLGGLEKRKIPCSYRKSNHR